jgi:hypothetical protein
MVELTTVLSIASSVVVAVLGVVVALMKYALATKEREIERLTGEANAKASKALEVIATQQERFHEREQRVTRLEGELNLVKASTNTLDETVHEIKDAMVPRHEWQAHAMRVDRTLESILLELRRSGPSRYPSSSLASPSPIPPPPRPSRPRGSGSGEGERE